MMDRRDFLAMSTCVIMGAQLPALVTSQTRTRMYGLIGKIIAIDGERDRLASILMDGIAGMPGCLSYIVASDAEDANALWVTEVWDSESSHGASLSLPSVRAAIQKGRPLIAGFGERHITTPIGGHGLTG